MITTKCSYCGCEIELKTKYGWTEKDQDRKNIVCDACDEVEQFLWEIGKED